jgi:hypothetical protein
LIFELYRLETFLKDNANVESRHFLFQPVLVQVKFSKYILGVNKTASNLAVLGADKVNRFLEKVF